MESSLLLFATVFIKIGLSFSMDSIFISFVSDNEIDTQSANQNFMLQPKEWEFLWLTEAFISYLKFSSGEVFFDSDSEKEFIINQLQPALIHESVDLSQHMTKLVHTTELKSLMVIEDDIISHKGNCIIRMLHLSLGNSIFHQSLINYLKLSEFQLMSLDDLWYSFQYQIDQQQIKLPKDIKTIMNSWIHQDGFPIVHVEIKNNIAKLRQNRYFTDGSTDNFENNTWWIPITWTSASNINSQSTIPEYWLHKKEDEIQLQIEEDEWVIFNVQQAGFYRVNYDELSWHRIIYALNFHHLNSIPAINRASIISDAFSLANTGIIPFEIALNSIIYIIRETDYLPIETALKELEFLFKYFDGQSSNKLFNKFWLALIKPSYDRLNQYDQVNGLFSRKLQKNLIYWACLLGHKQCVNNVLQNFERWKNNSKILITKHEKKFMFCIAVKYNSSLEENGAIKTILNYYSKTSNISDRAIAISSLKCIKDYEILQEILKMLLSNRSENVMEKQEILYAFKVIAKNSYKDAEFISDFIVTHHDIMLEYYGNNNIFIEIIESLFELLDVQKNSDQYYRYHTYIEEELIETIDTTFTKNIYQNEFYINYYTRIIKWIKNNMYFIPLDIERETKNTGEYLEVIERSFQFLKSFYEDNLSSDNLVTSTNLNNSLLNASYFFWKRTFNDWAILQSKITFLSDQNILKYHMLKIVSLIYDKLGFEEKLGDTYEDKVLRSDVIDWACRLNHPDCILKSLKLFKSWRSPLRSPIPKNIQKTVFCTAIKYEFQDMRFFVRKYIRTKSPHQKLAIEYALGCTSDVESIQNILSIILNIDDLRIEHQLRIISSINYYGGFGLQEILKYLCIINRRIPKDDKEMNQLYKIFEKVSTLISTHEQISLFQQCLEFYSDSIPSVDSSLITFIDQLIDDLNKFEQYSSNFLTWLRTTYISFDYRLPENLKPIKYELTIIPNFNTFYGLVKIILDVLYDSDRIVLHAIDLWIVEISVHNLNTDQSIGVLFFLQQLDGRCEIYLDSVIQNDTQLLVTITYGGFINDEKYGIYCVPLNNQDEKTDWIITTHFQMSHARRAFPCFDEPSFKAKFKIKILRPNDFISISNMNIIYSKPSPIKTNWSWDIYEESEIMSTYLVAFIICKHKTVFARENYLKYWSHHNSTPYAKYSLEVAYKAIEIMSAYTGILLPQKKIDFVEIPGFDMLGMENWGIVILDDQLSSLSSTRLNTNILQVITFKEFIVAHEIAHMWFGNLVTCETWEYFWLNEGFARYFEWTVMDAIQPQLKWMEKFIVHIQHVAFALDSHTVNLPLTNKKLTLITRKNVNKYDNSILIHAKAPCIVRMMQHAFGDELFSISIKYYLQENMWSTGTPSKLWSAIENTFRAVHYKTNESVATMMESWTSQPGYPVVHVNRTDKQLIFKQERFLSKRETEPMELYWIPITITTKSKPVFTNTLPVFWMGSRTESRSLPRSSDDEWIIVNIQQTGFYRVNYDVNTWNNIFKALNQKDFGGIPEINRAQILDDLFNLAYADYISYELAFIGAKYLSKERGYLPWKVFFNNIENLYEKFDSLIISMSLKKYIRDLITPYYNEIQPYENFSFDHKDDLNIVQIMTWARKVDLNLLVVKSLRKFNEWLQNTDMPMNLRIFTLCIVFQHSSYHEWKFLWNRYFKTPIKTEKLTLLKTFGCSRNVTTLTELIRFAVFNDYLKTEFDVKVALASIFYDERYSTDAILNFCILYHEELNAKSLWEKVHTLLLAISRNIYTSHQIQQLKKLIEILTNKNDQIREQLQDNLSQILIKKQWFDNHIVDVMQSLAKVEVFSL